MRAKKYHFWLLFFFTIFGFTFGMIVWTVKSAQDTPVYEDRSFLSSYHNVDDKFNQMMSSNENFSKKYDVLFDINGYKISGLNIDDIYLGERSLEKFGEHKNLLSVGDKNRISIYIKDKNSLNTINNADIYLLLSKAVSSNGDIELNSSKAVDGAYIFDNIYIPHKGYWNLNAKLMVGDDIGYFFIKTSTKN